MRRKRIRFVLSRLKSVRLIKYLKLKDCIDYGIFKIQSTYKLGKSMSFEVVEINKLKERETSIILE